MGGITLSNVKAYYIALVIKTLVFIKGQAQRIEQIREPRSSPIQIAQHKYAQLILTKGQKQSVEESHF